ncbi:hypothetical protein G7Y89_g12632 [Cudoniella acicularis]|uniref:Heterokaryon incompatibility domain-containing protein n=1 Tax=Cudoniella acicularis TaxID=354080 RepID=A0A8H4R8F2_9HELO|nr:hypothetical protein G7Y89_g12632 [Cudoniella acicularis]
MQPTSYPTRLLELGESTVRLVLPAEEKLSGPYATLSYCLGPNPTFINLAPSNLRELQVGIIQADLPIAFQESIHFIKGLPIRYVWIDTLCIIQSGPGSVKDWHSESAKMQDVYSNCIVNIALSRAAHPSESCLGGPTLTAIPPFEVETTGFFGNDDSAKSTATIVYFNYYREALYGQPLGFRVWALQERLLPPRVLSLGLGELFWDCIQAPNACESFPSGVGDLYSNFQLTDKAIPNASDSKTLESAWWTFVEEYTNRKLTYPEVDKLVAMSAIATRIGSRVDDVYIEGHFWKTLLDSLNWQVNPWWAQKNTAKDCRTGERGPRSLAVMKDYTLTLVDEMNPAGQVPFASLKLKAYCVEIGWNQDRPTMLGEPKWDDNVHFLKDDIDDPDERLAMVDGAKYWLAALVEGDYLAEGRAYC